MVVVLTVPVADVSVVVPVPVVPVAAVSVVVIVPVVPVVSVVYVPSVAPVVIDVSVAAVSVVASSFLHPTASMATASTAIREKTRDLFIAYISFSSGFQGFDAVRGTEDAGRALVAAHIIGRDLPMSSLSVVEADREPDHKTVVSFDGTTIHYDVYDALSPAVVLIVPGFWRDRRHPSMVHLARLLNTMGYRAVVVDVRGHGDSEGTYGFNLHEHHDVAAVAKDVLSQSSTISRLTLIGFSYGGAIAVSTVARHDLPVSSLLLISPVADFKMIAPRLNPFTIHRHIAFKQALKRPRFTWTVRRAAKLRALDDIENVHVPVCFIHVKNDWLIGHKHSVALYEAAREPKELHVLDIEGNYHADRIFSVAAGSVEPICRDFLGRHTPC